RLSSDRARSRSRRDGNAMSQSSRSSRRTMAEPAMPACPVTKTRLPRISKMTGAPLIGSQSSCSQRLIVYVAGCAIAPRVFQIGVDHLAHQFVERNLVV